MDELPPHARDLLAQARLADEPPRDASERVRGAVALAVSAGAAAAAGTAASHASASKLASAGAKVGWLTTTGAKLAVTGGVIAALSTTALVVRSTQRAVHERNSTTQVPLHVAKRAESRPTPPSAPSQTKQALAARPPVELAQPVQKIAALGHEQRPSTSGAHRSRTATSDAAEPSLHAEMSILYEASSALDRGQLAEARTLLSSHREQYANGQLREERLGLEVLEACMARGPTASVEAHRYLRAKPDALLGARIASACKLETDR
jgi:hypothetical protein